MGHLYEIFPGIISKLSLGLLKILITTFNVPLYTRLILLIVNLGCPFLNISLFGNKLCLLLNAFSCNPYKQPMCCVNLKLIKPVITEEKRGLAFTFRVG